MTGASTRGRSRSSGRAGLISFKSLRYNEHHEREAVVRMFHRYRILPLNHTGRDPLGSLTPARYFGGKNLAQARTRRARGAWGRWPPPTSWSSSSKTPAERDQDNIPMIVFNDPQIPDRTAFILDRTQPDPLPEMERVVLWLEDAGADYIAIPLQHRALLLRADQRGGPCARAQHHARDDVAHRRGVRRARDHRPARDRRHPSPRVSSKNYLSEAGLSVVAPSDEDQAKNRHAAHLRPHQAQSPPMTPRSCWTSRNACTRTAATRSSWVHGAVRGLPGPRRQAGVPHRRHGRARRPVRTLLPRAPSRRIGSLGRRPRF